MYTSINFAYLFNACTRPTCSTVESAPAITTKRRGISYFSWLISDHAKYYITMFTLTCFHTISISVLIYWELWEVTNPTGFTFHQFCDLQSRSRSPQAVEVNGSQSMAGSKGLVQGIAHNVQSKRFCHRRWMDRQMEYIYTDLDVTQVN